MRVIYIKSKVELPKKVVELKEPKKVKEPKKETVKVAEPEVKKRGNPNFKKK